MTAATKLRTVSPPVAGGLALVGDTSTSSGGAASSLAVAIPSGSNDDILIAIFACDDNFATGDLTVSDGTNAWTKELYNGSATGNDRCLVCFYHVRDGTEGANATLTVAVGSDDIHGYVVALSGGDTTTPIEASDIGAQAITTTPPSNTAFTAGASGDWAFFAIVGETGSITSIDAVPVGSTERVASVAVGAERFAVASEALTGSVDTGDWTIGSSSNRWVTMTVVVNVAP